MARDDDPEARIRELERTLSEQARASEVTVPGYHWSTPIGQAGRYSTPSGRPPASSAGRRLLFVAVSLAVLAAPIAAAVVFAGDYFGHRHPSSAGSSVAQLPSVSAPAAPPTQTDAQSGQSVVVNGTTVLAGPGLVELPTPSDDPGMPIQIAGVRGSRTLACDDRPVTISGVSNNVVITGHCTTVNVSGIDNTVTVDSADQIVASGMQNRVTYHSGTPDIPDPGESNTVTRG
jgi:hypothetical protein